MTKVLVFRYPDCGFEVNVPMMPGQLKTELSRLMGPVVSRKHRKQCDQCRRARRRSNTDEIVFRTRSDEPTHHLPNPIDASVQVSSGPFDVSEYSASDLDTPEPDGSIQD